MVKARSRAKRCGKGWTVTAGHQRKPDCSCLGSCWLSPHPKQDPFTIANPHPCPERQWALWSCSFCSGVTSDFFLYLVSFCLPSLYWFYGLALNGAFEPSSGLCFCRWTIPSPPLFRANNCSPPMPVKKRLMTGESGWIPTKTMKSLNNNRDFQSDLASLSACLETWIRKKEKPLPKLQSKCYILPPSREPLWRLPLGIWFLLLFKMKKKMSQVPRVLKAEQSNFFSYSELLFCRKKSQQLERKKWQFI